jgi:hypothetical protein
MSIGDTGCAGCCVLADGFTLRALDQLGETTDETPPVECARWPGSRPLESRAPRMRIGRTRALCGVAFRLCFGFVSLPLKRSFDDHDVHR